MNKSIERIDGLIIGGGPAGLTAATYLARCNRRVVLLDCNESRARYIPVSHNCPGYPFGVSGTDLLARMCDQGASFGIAPVAARVDVLATQGVTTQGVRFNFHPICLPTSAHHRPRHVRAAFLAA